MSFHDQAAEMEAQSPTDPIVLSVFLAEKHVEDMRKIIGLNPRSFVFNRNVRRSLAVAEIPVRAPDCVVRFGWIARPEQFDRRADRRRPEGASARDDRR